MSDTNASAIGVFDSGIGGLTTVLELKRIMPNESIIYFGDTSRVPYGTRSRETVLKYAQQDISFLLSHKVKLIIAACNTVSAVITNDIVEKIGVPFLEVLTPAANAAAKQTKTGKIGVIGTSITVSSGGYERVISAAHPDFEVTAVKCPLFVPLVENGFTDPDNKVTRLVAEEYLAPLIAAGVDTLILGCTHYPIISGIISSVMGEKVTLINSGQEVAKLARAELEKSQSLNSSSSPQYSYYVSDSTADFLDSVSKILNGQLEITSATQIDIESVKI